MSRATRKAIEWLPVVICGMIAMYAGATTRAQDSTASPLSAVTMSDVQAAMPKPADTVTPMETVTATAGVATTYRRSDASPIRITRATTVTTTSAGTFSGTWDTPLATANPNIVLTPISATQDIDCRLTAPPTATTFQGKCVITRALPVMSQLSGITLLTQLVTGINSVIATLTGYQTTVPADAGVDVQVIAIPRTQ